MRSALAARPKFGKMVVPFIVDESRSPIDFKELDGVHVRACADRRLCGICGERIEIFERLAFIGPRSLVARACFADAWMHEDCAALAMEQCPFLTAHRSWRQPLEALPAGHLLVPYERSMVLRTAPAGRAHRDALTGSWHFEALGPLREVG